MKIPKPSPLQIKTTKRLIWLAVSYFLSGMSVGAVAGLGWITSGLIGAGSALVRVGVAMSKSAAYNEEAKLTEAEADRIIKQAVDQSAQPSDKK